MKCLLAVLLVVVATGALVALLTWIAQGAPKS